MGGASILRYFYCDSPHNECLGLFCHGQYNCYSLLKILLTFSQTFPSLAAMRVLRGIASAPLETLVTSTVSDLFFVHQRGSRQAIRSVMLASGVLFG